MERECSINNYSQFFIENGAETTIVNNTGNNFQVVLGHKPNKHYLLSVVNLSENNINICKYEVAVFKIDKNGTIPLKNWRDPVVQQTFNDWIDCRIFYKKMMVKYSNI